MLREASRLFLSAARLAFGLNEPCAMFGPLHLQVRLGRLASGTVNGPQKACLWPWIGYISCSMGNAGWRDEVDGHTLRPAAQDANIALDPQDHYLG